MKHGRFAFLLAIVAALGPGLGCESLKQHTRSGEPGEPATTREDLPGTGGDHDTSPGTWSSKSRSIEKSLTNRSVDSNWNQ